MKSCKPDNHPQTMDKEKSGYKKRTTHLMSVGCSFLCGSISQGKELNCSATFLTLYRKDFTLSGQPADGSQDFGFRQFGLFLQLGKIINGPVDGNGILTAAVSPPFFRILDGRIDRHFRPYLFPFGIYAYLAQQLACSVFTDFGTVYIKQYRKCTATFDFHIISISFHNPIFCHYQITTENLSAIFLSNAFVSVSILLSVIFA